MVLAVHSVMLQLYAKVCIHFIFCFLDSQRSIVILVSASTYSNCTDGDVRLVDGSTPYEGRVEICINHAWGTVCGYHWDSVHANIVCKQLGYQPRGEPCCIKSDTKLVHNWLRVSIN